MRKRRIFLGLLLVIALMAFVACSNNDGTLSDPNTPNTVTDNKDNNGNADNNLDKAGNDLEDAADNAGDAAKDLVATDGAVNNNNNNNL